MLRENMTGVERCVRRVVQLFGLLLVLLVLEQNLEMFARALHVHPTAGTLLGTGSEEQDRSRGVATVVRIDAGSPLGRVGVRAGDVLTLPDPFMSYVGLSTRMPVAIDVDHAGTTTHFRLMPVPRRGRIDDLRAALSIAYLICVGLAGFLFVYGHRRTSALELGFALAAFAAPTTYLQPLFAGDVFWDWSAGVALAFTNVIAGVAFLAFAVRIEAQAIKRVSLRTLAVAIVVGLAALAVTIVDRGMLAVTAPRLGIATTLLVTDMLPLFVTIAILVRASWRADRDTWRRHATLIIGIGIIVLSQLVTDLGLAGHDDALHRAGLALQIAAGVVGAGLMTYGVLGQRVIDVGLFINRTLVYGLISLVLLVCFGLLEWAVNFFAPVHGRGSSAALGAGLALGVSLAFRRVHRFVENGVERLFFSEWRDREDELRTFLGEAIFFKQPEALSAAALAAFRRFAEDTAVAIYRRRPDGDFGLLIGEVDGFSGRLNVDMDMIVRLRATGRPSRTGAASLVLPMTIRNELTGVVILGCRPDGAPWRPDQIEALSGAARDIGQDLQVLEIDRLQAEVASLSQKLALAGQPPVRQRTVRS